MRDDREERVISYKENGLKRLYHWDLKLDKLSKVLIKTSIAKEGVE